jgi:hypothetical protein
MVSFINRAFGRPTHEPVSQETSEPNASAFNEDTSYPPPSMETSRAPESAPSDTTINSNKKKRKKRSRAVPDYNEVGAGNNEKTMRPRQEQADWFGRRMRDWWVREIASLLFSIGSISAIVIVLAKCV